MKLLSETYDCVFPDGGLCDPTFAQHALAAYLLRYYGGLRLCCERTEDCVGELRFVVLSRVGLAVVVLVCICVHRNAGC
jgi:hypothetical protein